MVVILAIVVVATFLMHCSDIKLAMRQVHLDIRDYINRGKRPPLMIIDYNTYDWDRALEFPHVAVLKFIERVPHFSKERRTEYIFEVVEWLNGGKGESKISVFSPYYSGYTYTSSVMEAYEEDWRLSGRCKGYEVGGEYLLPLVDYAGGYGNADIFCFQIIEAVMEWSKTNKYWKMFVSVAYPEGVESLSKEEFLKCIKNGFDDPEAFRTVAMEIQREIENAAKEKNTE